MFFFQLTTFCLGRISTLCLDPSLAVTAPCAFGNPSQQASSVLSFKGFCQIISIFFTLQLLENIFSSRPYTCKASWPPAFVGMRPIRKYYTPFKGSRAPSFITIKIVPPSTQLLDHTLLCSTFPQINYRPATPHPPAPALKN